MNFKNSFRFNKTVAYNNTERANIAFMRQHLNNIYNEHVRKTHGLYPVQDGAGNIIGYVVSLSVGQDDIED